MITATVLSVLLFFSLVWIGLGDVDISFNSCKMGILHYVGGDRSERCRECSKALGECGHIFADPGRNVAESPHRMGESVGRQGATSTDALRRRLYLWPNQCAMGYQHRREKEGLSLFTGQPFILPQGPQGHNLSPIRSGPAVHRHLGGGSQ